MNITKKLIKLAVVLAALSSCAVQAAEDRTIAANETVTLEENAEYGKLTVLGRLNLAAGVTVTATSIACDNAAGEEAVVTLEDGSLLKATEPWQMAGDGTFRVDFRGGKAEIPQLNRTGGGTNVFNGVDHPIRIVVNGSLSPIFAVSSSSRILFTGNGGFERYGNSTSPFNDYSALSRVVMDYSGDTVLKEGTFSYQGVPLPATTDLKIERGALFVTYSIPFAVNSISGDGAIAESNYSVPVTLAGEGADTEFVNIDSELASITKNGPSSATVASRNVFDTLTVNQGTLGVKSRAEAGFPNYLFLVNKVRSGTSLVFSEFFLYGPDGTDVTGLRTNDLTPKHGDPSALYDRKTWTEWWTSAGNGNVVQYAASTPVAAYTFKTANQNDTAYAPVSWTLRGCLDYVRQKWMIISLRTDFPTTLERAAFASAEPFPVDESLREVTAKTVTLAHGATLAVKGRTTLVASNLTAEAASVALSDGGRLALVSDAGEDRTEWYVNVSGAGALEKRGAGSYTLNEATIGADVCVREGTLKLASGFAEENTSFKFEFLKVQRNVTTGTDAEQKLQFSKIRFYDAAYTPYGCGWSQSIADNGYWDAVSGAADIQDAGLINGCYTSKDKPLICSPGSTVKPIAYRLADFISGGDPGKMPAVWNVYARKSSAEEWKLIDHREILSSTTVRGWKAYNGGMYFYFTNRYDTAKAAIAAGRSVTICRGATLDVTETKAVLDDLVIDGTGSGNATLKGGELAATGTLALNGVSLADKGAVLLVLDGTTVPKHLAGWTVTVDGVSKPRWRLAIRDGALVIGKQGLTILFK